MEPESIQDAQAQTNDAGWRAQMPPVIAEWQRFFQPVDWLSFGLTTSLALSVYLLTLAPEVTLEMSGQLSTAAMYGGVAHPPGFPLWTIYAWIFTRLLPFSNIAWRVAVSSAVAGALTCGVIALMVSRGGAMITSGIRGFRRLDQKEERCLRLIAGYAAGLVYGFNGVSWNVAVTVDTRPLSMLVFSVVLCLFLRWAYAPGPIRYLYAAFFVYGLAVSASQIVLPLALALPFFAMFGDRRLGRDLFLAATVFGTAIVVGNRFGHLSNLSDQYGLTAAGRLCVWICVLTGVMCVALIVVTRGLFTKWRQAVTAGSLSLLGTLPHLLLPLASMTNPPNNWGYARTVEGFFHVLGRGQFERISPSRVFDGDPLLLQLWNYGEVAIKQFGLIYVLAALIPFCFLHRMWPRERGVILGFVAFFLCSSVFMVILLNPPPDRQASGLAEQYFTASYIILSLWTGYGLVLLGTFLARLRNPFTAVSTAHQ